MHNNLLAVGFGLLSALFMAGGTVWRHRIMRAGAARGEMASSPMQSMRRPAWWASLGMSFLAYAFQAVALAFGSVLVVQPVLALSLMLTLLLSARADHRWMHTAEAFWAVLLTVSVAGVVLLGRPVPGTREPATWEWAAVNAFGLAVAVVAMLFGSRRSPNAKALTYGAVCGTLFGYQAVFSKVAVDAYVSGGMEGLLGAWEFWALLVTATAGTMVQQYAFAAGNLATSLPAARIAEPMVAFILGMVILGERIQAGGIVGWVAVGASISIMLLSAAMLTRVSVR